MKTGLLKKAILVCCAVIASALSVNAQVQDSVSIMPGYTNRTFYQMNSGTVSSVSNTDWDLGFQFRGRTGSIIINAKNNVHLWKANKAITEWSTMMISDTTGDLISSNELHNSETTWDLGAFNITNDPANLFDLGWGLYDLASHNVLGDSIYFISLANNTVFKKIKIDMLDGNNFDYTFHYADLDGSNEVQYTANKTSFPNKFFGYYSLTNNVSIDREPVYNSWDLSFEGYSSGNVIPNSYYPVTGVLMNDSVFAVKAYPVDTATATDAGLTYSNTINTIGFDWKRYDMTLMQYVIEDSIVYFIKDHSSQIWKLVFTGFGGGANGNFYFTKTAVSATGLIENSTIRTFAAYPNPAHDNVRMMIDSKNSAVALVCIFDLSGKLISNKNIELNGGLQAVDVDVRNFNPGLYQVTFIQGTERQISRIVIQ